MDATIKKVNLKKILFIILNVIFYVLIILLLLFAIANMKVKTEADIPNIFGTGYLSVESDSMTGEKEDSFNERDMIIVNMLNDKERAVLEVGDIITFYDGNLRALNTHRIVEVLEDIEGNTVFATQGDKANAMEEREYIPGEVNNEEYYELVNAEDAIAKHKNTWANFGGTFNYITSPSGFALVIVLPTVIFLIFEVFLLVRNILQMNNEKMKRQYASGDKEDLINLDAAKEQMRQQILEELKQEQLEKETKENNKSNE